MSLEVCYKVPRTRTKRLHKQLKPKITKEELEKFITSALKKAPN